MRISDWSSDVCSSDLVPVGKRHVKRQTTCRSRRTACRIFVNTLLIAKDIYPGQRERRTLTAKAGEPSRDRRPSFRDAVSWTKTRSSGRSEKHTSALQLLLRNSHAVFCLKKKNNINTAPQLLIHRHSPK